MAQRLGSPPLGKGLSRFLTRLPGNECFLLEVTEKPLPLPRLSPQLDGLTISHLSDIHFAGAIDKKFFVEIMEMTNKLDSDLILITGDLVDKPDCIDWVADTFGRLRARHGVYFIFGNHDVRLKKQISRLRSEMVNAGLTYVGGRWVQCRLHETSIILGGNELPWIRPATDMRSCPPRCEAPHALRILLSHSPDQYGWARRHDFDLMLAGHNHGGQIRLPVVGPLFSPSRYGVRYACGTFYEPPTVMHVSRGVSALDPLRFNCTPELARLVLRSPQPKRTDGAARAPTIAMTGIR
jgi:predicted MPP superfamily phosphohydrolase